jgi:hypothetical protein
MGRVEPNTYVHRQYWGWHNAPPFRSYTAARKDGGGGWFWGAKFNGQIWVSIETDNRWSDWGSFWDVDFDDPVRAKFTKLAAAGHREALQLWAIDGSMRLWSAVQDSYGLWNWSEANWNNALPLFRIAAVKLGGPRTVAIWAITATDYSLTWCYKEGNTWSSWSTWKATPNNARFMDVAAAQQANGCAALWALDTGHNLWFCQENTPGGPWSDWSGPQWNGAPPDWSRTGVPLWDRIAACQQGGNRGALLCTLSAMNLAKTYQLPGGTWSPWSLGFGKEGGGHTLGMATTQQSNGAVRLWITSPHDLSLHSIAQTSADGDWGKWEAQYIQ